MAVLDNTSGHWQHHFMTTPVLAATTLLVPMFMGWFVRQDYFCYVEGYNIYTYTDEDRLWDGYDCLSTAPRCCDKGPWFCKDLPQATSDDIEFRVCADEGRHIELYETLNFAE